MALSQDFEFRFSGVTRILGESEAVQLNQSHFMVIGLGGVGSWCAEALVRSGLGELTLVDFDDVCVSNTNRQVQALDENVGKPKIQVLKERFLKINPEIQIHLMDCPFDEDHKDKILNHSVDLIVDCMDDLRNKVILISQCRKRKIPLVTSGAAGGRRDPSKIVYKDLAFTEYDPLLQQARKQLRRNHGFPRFKKQKFKIPAIFSMEKPVYPTGDGCVTEEPLDKDGGPLDCQSGFGTLSFVTGTMGFFVASTAIKTHLNN